jgi:hypothetical protein
VLCIMRTVSIRGFFRHPDPMSHLKLKDNWTELVYERERRHGGSSSQVNFTSSSYLFYEHFYNRLCFASLEWVRLFSFRSVLFS